MSTLQDRLRLVRERAGFTQHTVADKTGINRNTLANWELGRSTPKWDDIKLLADFFDVSVDWLIGRDNHNNSNNGKPDLKAPLKEKSRADALQKISELDSQFDMSEEVLLDLIRQVRKKFGPPSNKEDTAATDKTRKGPDTQPTTVKEPESEEEYRPDLEELVPRDEVNLAEAMIKISEIGYTHNLTKEESTYLMHRAVEHYGAPEYPEETYEAAHGPQVPGQIDWDKKEDE